MNKDITLGILVGFILATVLIGVGGFFLLPKLIPIFGLSGTGQPAGGSMNGPSKNHGQPSSQQQGSQSNGTLFGCPELKLAGTQIIKAGVPFTVKNTDSKPHKIYISTAEYSFAAGETKTITISGQGAYTIPCDGSNFGNLNVE
ncbi:MAG TPA: hypothetical protein VMU70_02465 [Candidatus Tyrphobacter sp.]|nr:hypothetical protein [Candidatus Tyrphobacter sp.]